MKVLVTNASYHNTLAVTRALGEKGIEVTVGEKCRTSWMRRHGLAYASKYCRERRYYTDPYESVEKFVDDIVEIVREDKYDVLLPIGVETVIPILMHKKKLGPFVKVPFGNYEKVIKVHDKARVLKIAGSIGVPVPKTYFPDSIGEVEKIASKISFPVVIKARRGAGATGVWYANNQEELITLYKKVEKQSLRSKESRVIFDMEKPLLQEYISGKIHDVCLLADNGKVLALLTQKRLKTLPVRGGSGIMNITTNIPILKKYARDLIEESEYHGVAQVEFKYDPKNEQYKLMEINPKFWGTLALSIEAGINFPYLAVKLALGEKIEPIFDYQVGLTYRWIFPHEILALFEEKNKLKALKDLISFPMNDTKTDFRVGDFRPNLVQMGNTVYKLISKLRSRQRKHCI